MVYSHAVRAEVTLKRLRRIEKIDYASRGLIWTLQVLMFATNELQSFGDNRCAL
jgi:hypothetical protein